MLYHWPNYETLLYLPFQFYRNITRNFCFLGSRESILYEVNVAIPKKITTNPRGLSIELTR